MHFEVVKDISDIEAMAAEWNELVLHSASHVPFLRHEYMVTWWRTLGGGEWANGDLSVVTARKTDGSLTGIAPLFFTHNRQGDPALMFLGSIEISDYLDIIARPEDTPAFLNGLIDFLLSPQVPAWKVLDLYNLLDSSPTLPLLRQAAEVRSLEYSEEVLQHCPYIPLPADWDLYLESLDKKQRHEIRRKMRRAYEHYEPVRWYIVGDGVTEDALDKEIDAFLNLMEHDPRKAQFLTEAMRAQMKTAIHAAYQNGWLQLAFIEMGGEKVAVYLNFDYLNQIWVYNSGFDQRYYDLSLGWVLLAHLLEWSIENGRQAFDFMRGEEQYKYRFGAIDRRVIRALVCR